VRTFTSEVTDEDFVQAKGLLDVLGKQMGQQENFVYDISVNLKDALPVVQMKKFAMFSHVDSVLGQRIKTATLSKSKEK